MDKYVMLQKKDFSDFITDLAKIQKLVAPVLKGYNNFVFEEVSSANEIADSYIPTILPPKKYFMPQKEKILEFDVKNQKTTPVVEFEELTLFGVRTCDLSGIHCLNMVFDMDPKDVNYIERRNKITIIGMECNDYCDEYASCAVMHNHLPNGGYDLFMTDLGDYYMVHIGTDKGEKIVSDIKFFKDVKDENRKALEVLRAKKREIFKEEVKVSHKDLKEKFVNSFKDKVWEEIEDKCLSCGNCTNVCPTCYCFDIKDNLNLDLNTGCRVRVWDSCQNETFALVAGGESFREERSLRQQHRYMRKFNYPVDKFNRYFCTGCGRCSRACMAKINLKETIDSL